jgi:hypothetical protein
MSEASYAEFQKIQCALFDLVDAVCPIETVEGNEIFQRLSDAAFSVLSEQEKKK